MTGDIKVAGVAADTNVAFKICALFTRCVAHINDEHVETVENLDIIMATYNLIEYSDNYIKYKVSLLEKADDADGNHISLKKCKNSCSTKTFIYFF